MNPALGTTKYVVHNSKHVSLGHDAILRFCENLDLENLKNWWQEAPFGISDLETEQRLKFLFLFNAISFSYWAEPRWSCQKQAWYEPTWMIKYQGQKYNGAWGLISDLAKALLNERLKLDCKEWKTITKEKLAGILNENGIEMPLLDERLSVIKEIGRVLLEEFNGEVSNLVKAANGDAMKLLGLILSSFPSFQDSSFFQEQEIFFHKRSQLLVADICNNSDFNMENMDQLTACADYKIPQVLRRLGVLEYSKELAEKVDQKDLIPRDSEEEIEIRAATIWAVEHIKEELSKKYPKIKSIDINDYFWLLGQQKYPGEKPYHRTRTTAY